MPRAHQIDDRVREPGQGCEFHGAVQLDQVDVHAFRREMLARSLQVLGGDAQPRARAYRMLVGKSLAHGNHQPAARDFQVERLVQSAAAVLGQQIPARDAEVGGSVLHISRHIGRAHDDEPHSGARRCDDQLARRLRVFRRDDARCFEQRQSFIEDAPFR